VKAADGTNVWSESYDRELKDIFAVQTEIAGAVAAQLKVALLGNNAQSVQALPESTPSNQNVEAYSALLQGRFYEQRRTAEDQRKAIEYYQEAIRLDPKYALAYAHMSRAKTRLIAVFTVSESERAQLIAEMREAADTALALQPDLGVAHQARAAILQLIDLDVAASESEFRRAAELDPQETQTALSLGILNSSNGRLAEGVAYGTKATVLDPLNSTAYVYLSRTLVALGRYDEAEAVLRKGIELQPQAAQSYCEYSIVEILRGNPAAALKLAKQETDAFWRMFALALAHFANGNKTEADAELESLIAEYADSGAFQIAMVYALRKEPDKVFEWLDHGFVTHDPGVTTVRYAAFLNAYSADPRFAAFCKKLGLSPPQQGTQSRAMPEPAGNTPSIERKS
jgi:tetratricopeptide (TPR) repeat protein